MNWLKKIWASSSFGQLAITLFMICIVSGIFLAVPFNINNPYESISVMLIASPVATLFRNLHYWSAQLFLIISLVHIYDHFRNKEGIRLKKALWARLSIGVLIIFLAMLTGFLLKADADSRQAWHILNSLTSGIPFIGGLISYSLLGNEGNLQLIYVHHIATFTIFIAVILFEHARKIWPKWSELVFISLVLLILSFYITAPLHDNLNPTVKGPWYFLGLQEILHWLTHPEWVMLLIVVLIVLVFLVPSENKKQTFLTKRTLLILTIAYFLLTLSGLFFRGANWEWIWPWQDNYINKALPQIRVAPINLKPDFSPQEVTSSPVIDGHKESCLICHDQVTGFTLSHDPKALGCFSCHGGRPFESDKDRAHDGMLVIPGNLTDAGRSCGTTNCHPQITERINTSLMSTLSGMISVDRFVFNEQGNPDLLTDIHHLGNSAADEHLRNLCVRCHLGNPKTESGPITESSRGGGCLACHLNYDQYASAAYFEKQFNSKDTTYLRFHPSVDLQVSSDHCFGCHSRSARISTNYEGWHETTLKTEDVPANEQYRVVEGTRVFKFVEEDVHHRLRMTCIDCHNSYELMGNGSLYAHEEKQVTIQCTDCHLTSVPKLIDHSQLDQESAIIASLRFGDVLQRKFLVSQKRNKPLINTYFSNDTAFMEGKNSRKLFAMKKPAEICTRGDAHDDLSCSSCHTSWAPSCIGCHNEYDPNETGFDMYANKEMQGNWVEYIGQYNAHLPALGIREDSTGKTIIPVIPGMILTIDVNSFDKSLHDSLIFQRLFAPTEAHTTQTKGRDCKSCHNNPVALGFGDGKLVYRINDKSGKWIFSPKYQNNIHDGLPEDSWIGFLKNRTGKVSTRSDVRPFSIEEQKRILQVGACLTCHDENSTLMNESLTDYKGLLKKLSPKCILPTY